ncbi:MAG: hypothetical protein HY701_10290 [Gemmatimonadetes bacterium]|nr:hypothetical protein [Gemmatimonadota bacterium]
MSLIRVRRERKKAVGLDFVRAKSTWKLLFLLAAVIAVIWLLGTVQ